MKDDLVIKMNQSIDNALNRVTATFNDRLDKLIPHGLFDEPVSHDEEVTEYIATVAQHPDPVASSMELMNGWAGQYGWPKARTMYAEYIKRNERRIQSLGQTTNATQPVVAPPSGSDSETSY